MNRGTQTAARLEGREGDGAVQPMDWLALQHEYGCDAKRFVHPDGSRMPVGGAWAVVRAGTTSLLHVNEPADEEEMFVCVRGRAVVIVGDERTEIGFGDTVFLRAGTPHAIDNPFDDDVHVVAMWWNTSGAREYLDRAAPATPSRGIQ